MRISKGDVVEGKVVAEVSSACKCAGQLFRSARFEDGTFGILHISNGVVTITDFGDSQLRRILRQSVQVPKVGVTCGGERLLIHGEDSNGGFRLELQC